MKRGDQVAEFELPDQTGHCAKPHRIARRRPDRAVLLPCGDDARAAPRRPATSATWPSEFAAVGASRVGISTDAVEKQAKFADKQSFDYPLLSDAEGTVATQFGVKRGLLGKFMPVKRTTFVIDTDRTVLDVIASEVSMDTHADKALEVLRQRQSA